MTSATDAVETTTIDGSPIQWDGRLLEPRAWTAEQGVWAAELAARTPPGPILELCAGAGHIGLVAARHSGRDLVQIDREPAAALHARENARVWGIATQVRCADVEEALAAEERCPVVIVDPPWLTTDQLTEFPEDPRAAVDGGPDGLTALRTCLRVALEHVADGGAVVLQAGTPAQVEQVVADVETAELVEMRDLRPGGVLVHLARR